MPLSEQDQAVARLGGEVLAELVEHAPALLTAGEVLTSLNAGAAGRWCADDVDLGVHWLEGRGLIRREGQSLVMTAAACGMLTLIAVNERIAGGILS